MSSSGLSAASCSSLGPAYCSSSSYGASSSASASASSSRIYQSDLFDQVSEIIEDPITTQPMDDPVVAVRCGHTFSRESAMRMEAQALAEGRGLVCLYDRIPFLNREEVQANSLMPAHRVEWFKDNYCLRDLIRSLPSLQSAMQRESQMRGVERGSIEARFHQVNAENAALASQIKDLTRIKDDSNASIEALNKRIEHMAGENQILMIAIQRVLAQVSHPAPPATQPTTTTDHHPMKWVANQLEPLTHSHVPGNLIAIGLKNVADLLYRV